MRLAPRQPKGCTTSEGLHYERGRRKILGDRLYFGAHYEGALFAAGIADFCVGAVGCGEVHGLQSVGGGVAGGVCDVGDDAGGEASGCEGEEILICEQDGVYGDG